MEITLATPASPGKTLKEQILKSGAFLERDGAIGFVIDPITILRTTHTGSMFLATPDALDSLIENGEIVRALNEGEVVSITI